MICELTMQMQNLSCLAVDSPVMKGITLRGLRKLEARVKDLFDDGYFKEDVGPNATYEALHVRHVQGRYVI